MQKKHLTLIIVLLTLGFGAYIYFNPPSTHSIGTQTRIDTVIQNNPNQICSDYSNVAPSELPALLVKDMIKNYRDNQLPAIAGASSNAVPNDAHAIWFDLDTLKSFIYNIERSVHQNTPSTSPNPKLGLRVYYAAYPNSSLWTTTGYEPLAEFANDSEKSQYGHKHTVVVIPTIYNGSVYTDFNPTNANTYTTGLKGLWKNEEIPNNLPIMAFTAFTGGPTAGESIGARNHGQLFPPGPSTGEAF